MLHMQYLNYMEEKSPNTFNPHYSTQKIKPKLTGHFGGTPQFWLLTALCKSELVYSSAFDIGDVIMGAIKKMETERLVGSLVKVGATVHNIILTMIL